MISFLQELPVPPDTFEVPVNLLDILLHLPPVCGWVIIAASLIPLLFGWRIMRVMWVVMYGLMLGTLSAASVLEAVGPWAAGGIGLAAAILGGYAGYYMQKVNAAIIGGILLGLMAAIPGAMIQGELLAAGLGIVGFGIGLVLGWKATYYLDAVETSLTGAMGATLGAMIAVPNKDDTGMLVLIGLATFLVSGLGGMVVQFKAIKKEGKAPKKSNPDRA